MQTEDRDLLEEKWDKFIYIYLYFNLQIYLFMHSMQIKHLSLKLPACQVTFLGNDLLSGAIRIQDFFCTRPLGSSCFLSLADCCYSTGKKKKPPRILLCSAPLPPTLRHPQQHSFSNPTEHCFQFAQRPCRVTPTDQTHTHTHTRSLCATHTHTLVPYLSHSHRQSRCLQKAFGVILKIYGIRRKFEMYIRSMPLLPYNYRPEVDSLI